MPDCLLWHTVPVPVDNIPTYQLQVSLDGVTPRIWRRFRIPADARLDDLHHVIQVVMGWQGYHLHEFVQGRQRYGIPDPDGMDVGPRLRDEMGYMVGELLTKPHQRLTYVYDFGDNWVHSILLETIDPVETEDAVCLAGERACPPEDCGGPSGYADLLEVLADPQHDDHQETRAWYESMVSAGHDPEVFPLAAVNEHLAIGLDGLWEEYELADDEVGALDDLIADDSVLFPQAGGGGLVPELLAGQPKAAGRNDPCPCGSGRKYKKCCGR